MKGRGRIGLAGLLLALAVLVAVPGASGAQGGGGFVTLQIKNAEVDLGSSTVLKGRLSGVSSGNEGQIISIIAQEFPYKRSRKIDTVPTGTNGVYRISVKPTLNTIYRAVGPGGVKSKRIRAYVFPVKLETKVDTLRGNRASARFFVKYPSDYPLPLDGRRITWYFRKAANPIFSKIATSRTTANEQSRVNGDVVFDLPRSRQGYRYFVTWCFALGKAGQDIGIGRNAGGGCPDSFRDSSTRVAARMAR